MDKQKFELFLHNRERSKNIEETIFWIIVRDIMRNKSKSNIQSIQLDYFLKHIAMQIYPENYV